VRAVVLAGLQGKEVAHFPLPIIAGFCSKNYPGRARLLVRCAPTCRFWPSSLRVSRNGHGGRPHLLVRVCVRLHRSNLAGCPGTALRGRRLAPVSLWNSPGPAPAWVCPFHLPWWERLCMHKSSSSIFPPSILGMEVRGDVQSLFSCGHFSYFFSLSSSRDGEDSDISIRFWSAQGQPIVCRRGPVLSAAADGQRERGVCADARSGRASAPGSCRAGPGWR
jgi:hypothetical protein